MQQEFFARMLIGITGAAFTFLGIRYLFTGIAYGKSGAIYKRHESSRYERFNYWVTTLLSLAFGIGFLYISLFGSSNSTHSEQTNACCTQELPQKYP